MKKFHKNHFLRILSEWDEQKTPLDYFLSCYYRKNKSIGSKDRKYISEMLFTLLRWKKLIDSSISRPLNWEKRLSALENLSNLKKESKDLPKDIAYSFPTFLWEKWQKQYGEKKAEELCILLNGSAPLTIRVNGIKTTRENLLSLWKELYSISPTVKSSTGIIFKERAALFQTPEFKQGWFEVQDEGSQIIAEHLRAKPGMQILDFCSGSGGKTLAFAPYMKGKGQVYLHDIRKSILLQAKKRLKRAGIEWAQPVQPGSRALSLLKRKMDIVLVDVPCSGTGTLRRNPEQKWRLTETIIKNLVLTQRQIFEQALTYLKPGGKIIYATCSLLSEENEDQIKYFLEKFPLELSSDPTCLLPENNGNDGFFFASFHRKENIDKMTAGNSQVIS